MKTTSFKMLYFNANNKAFLLFIVSWVKF